MRAPVSVRGQKRNRIAQQEGDAGAWPASPWEDTAYERGGSGRARTQQTRTRTLSAEAIDGLAAVRRCGGRCGLRLTLRLRHHRRMASLPLRQQNTGAAQTLGMGEEGIIFARRRSDHRSQRGIFMRRRRRGDKSGPRDRNRNRTRHSFDEPFPRLYHFLRATATRQGSTAQTQQQKCRSAHGPQQRIISACNRLVDRCR